MKKVFFGIVVILLLVTSLLLAGCSADGEEVLTVDDEGNTTINTEVLSEVIADEPIQGLTETEATGIQYMREEEKLARDVYLALYEKWGTNTFSNIGSSEETHMDAMKTLIDRYGLDDPAQGQDMGAFTNDILQQLYNDLVALGSKSELDALQVGAAIEEIDILDIEEYVAQTDKADIITVYENLLKGSRNHLRSFVSVMEKRGMEYQPQYLSEEQYNDIVGGEIERGGR